MISVGRAGRSSVIVFVVQAMVVATDQATRTIAANLFIGLPPPFLENVSDPHM